MKYVHLVSRNRMLLPVSAVPHSYLCVLFFVIQSHVPLRDWPFLSLTSQGNCGELDESCIHKPQLETSPPPAVP